MRGRAGLGAVVVFAFVAFAATPVAEAARLCVKDPSGPAPPGTCDQTFATLAAAFTEAEAISGTDEVIVGVGTFAGGDTATPVNLAGQGRATDLIGGGAPGSAVVDISNGSLSHLDVGAFCPASFGLLAREVADVHVSAGPTCTNTIGIRNGTGAVSDVVIDLGSTDGSIGIYTDGPVRRASVRAETGFTALSGTIQISSSAAFVSGSSEVGVDSYGASVTVTNSSLIGDGSADGSAFSVRGEGGLPPNAPGILNIFSSVARGFGATLRRTGDTTFPVSTPVPAFATISYSSLDLAAGEIVESGAGTFTPGAGNIGTPNPLFVNQGAGDLRLLNGSPLVDTGDPAGLTANESTTDLAGGPRIVGPRRNIGAFEGSATPPPPPVIPKPVVCKRLKAKAFKKKKLATVKKALKKGGCKVGKTKKPKKKLKRGYRLLASKVTYKKGTATITLKAYRKAATKKKR